MKLTEEKRGHPDRAPKSRTTVIQTGKTVELIPASRMRDEMQSRADWMEATSKYTRAISNATDASADTASATASITADFTKLTQESKLFLGSFSESAANLGASALLQASRNSNASQDAYMRLWDRGRHFRGLGKMETQSGGTTHKSEWSMGLGLSGRSDVEAQLADRARMQIMMAAWAKVADESKTDAVARIPLLGKVSTARLNGTCAASQTEGQASTSSETAQTEPAETAAPE